MSMCARLHTAYVQEKHSVILVLTFQNVFLFRNLTEVSARFRVGTLLLGIPCRLSSMRAVLRSTEQAFDTDLWKEKVREKEHHHPLSSVQSSVSPNPLLGPVLVPVPSRWGYLYLYRADAVISDKDQSPLPSRS